MPLQLKADVKTVILLGTDREPWLETFCRAEDIAIPQGLGEEGFAYREKRTPQRVCLAAVSGGKRGVLYAAGDLKNRYLAGNGTDAWLASSPADGVFKPRFKYRWFWTWDHRMDWTPGEKGAQAFGCSNPYLKRPEAYLSDYKRAIDFCCDHKINGIVIWGFLRDSHGGEAYAKEICHYAKEREVAILPGVGLGFYGGYYYQGKHQFNLETYQKAHCSDKRPCPSQPETQEYYRKGMKWLIENFEIGGVNIENGDFCVCKCPVCTKGREGWVGPDYYYDMAMAVNSVVDAAHQLKPDLWLSYATYTGFNLEMMANPPTFLKRIPEYAICQWNVFAGSKHLGKGWGRKTDEPVDAGLKCPAPHSIGYTYWPNQRYAGWLDVGYLKYLADCADTTGLEGLSIYGESGADQWNRELNYLAFEEFTFYESGKNVPMQDALNRFAQRYVAPRYGQSHAAKLMEIVELTARHVHMTAVKDKYVKEDCAKLERALSIASDVLREVQGVERANWQKVHDWLRWRQGLYTIGWDNVVKEGNQGIPMEANDHVGIIRKALVFELPEKGTVKQVLLRTDFPPTATSAPENRKMRYLVNTKEVPLASFSRTGQDQGTSFADITPYLDLSKENVLVLERSYSPDPCKIKLTMEIRR